MNTRSSLKELITITLILLADAAYAAEIVVGPISAASPQPAQTSVASAPSGATELHPGMTLGGNDADRFSSQIPAAAKLAMHRGFRIHVTPTERLEWSAGFERATEKYSPQVVLDAHDHLAHYTAGMPFPLIDAADPKAAAKIAYNWHMGPVLPDDFSLAPWGSSGYSAGAEDPKRIVSSEDNDFACEQFDFLRFAHRTEVEPRPTLGENSMGVEWKARCSRWTVVSIGADAAEGAGIWVRYLDPARSDAFYGFSEATRRVRRSVSLEPPSEGCRACHQPYWAYALPKTENYSYRLLGSATILACMRASHEPAGIVQGAGGYSLTEEPFQLRRAYILEMTPRESAHGPNARTLVYIDSEIYVWLAAEFFEGGELSAVSIPLWRMTPSPEGGNLFDIAGSFYFPTSRPDYFRSLVPAHTSFTQKINRGEISEGAFVPQAMR